MTSDSPIDRFREHEIEFRVRYQETDAQGHVHHANYFKFFEMGRIEMLRAGGYDYRALEDEGTFLVVTELSCKFHRPAFFDDLLTLKTTTVKAKGVRIEHHYELKRGNDVLVQGRSVVASINKEGKIQRLPEWLSEK